MKFTISLHAIVAAIFIVHGVTATPVPVAGETLINYILYK